MHLTIALENFNLLVDMAHSHRNIYLIEHPKFSGEEGLLRDEFGRFRDGLPNPIDILHLGEKGIRLFAQQIKYRILERQSSTRGKVNSSRRDSRTAVGSPSAHHCDGYQPPSRNGV